MAFIVHPHFHARRTGATRHIEDMVRALAPDAVSSGSALMASIPRLSLSALWRRARREPTIWHAHRLNELYVGLLFRWLLPNVRVVFTRHAGAPASRWTRFWVSRADRVVALTDEARANLGLPSADLVSHGVDLEAFKPPRSRTETWSALNLGGQRGIGVIGRIRPAKGQADFVEAIAPLLSKHPEWKSVLIGATKPAEHQWATALASKVGPALALVDEQPNIAPWYQGLSVVVHPSHTEGFSLVLLEAMASGCCVIATRLAAVGTVIEHEKTGLLYEPGDVSALRALLERVMSNPDEAQRLGEAARAHVAAWFGLEREAAALRAIYAQLESPRSGRAGVG